MADNERKPLLDKSNAENPPRGASELHSQTHPNPGVRVNRRVAHRNNVNIVTRRPSSNENGQQNLPLNPNTTSNSWSVRWALVIILISVILERLTFYGLTGNLVLFLNLKPFQWESYHAMNAMFTFFGVTYIFALLGGWFADAFLGRFKAMLLAYVIYIIGYAFLPFMADKTVSDMKLNSNMTINTSLPGICGNTHEIGKPQDNPFEENCAWLVFVVLIIIGIGCGVLKANICPFGSDQLIRANQQTQLSFFNWYYWCVNMGCFIGLVAMAYTEQQFSFHIGYIICTACLCVSGLVFLLGRFCYLSRPPDGSVLSNIFKIIREAWLRKRQRKQLIRISRQSAIERAEGEIDEASRIHENINFLDYAKHRNGGIFHNSLVDDVKKLKVILIVFAVLIPYWIVYFQMQTTFLIQGLHMKLDFSSNVTTSASIIQKKPSDLKESNRPEIVAAWFTLFDAIFVIILLPLFDRVIYPRMSRAGYPFTFPKRIILGMMFAMAAMIVAGAVEHVRLGRFWPDNTCNNASINQWIGNTKYEAADMSVFWQIPQYALIGISEVFASVACLQFAVTVAPKSMKAIITGLFYFFSGIGSLLGTAILSVLAKAHIWFFSHDYGNINCRLSCNINVTQTDYGYSCHLDYYFYFLAGLEFVAVLLFLLVIRAFGLNYDELGTNPRQREEPANRNVQRANSTPSSS